MKPEDVLDFAYKIYTENQTEVAYRASIGRSYYSVFYPATSVINQLGLRGSGNTHDKVVSAFSGKHHALHNAINDLLSMRVEADYHLNAKVTAQKARVALAKAKKLQEKLQELQSS